MDNPVRQGFTFMSRESMCALLEKTRDEVWLLAIPFMSLSRISQVKKESLTGNFVSFSSKYKTLYPI